MNEENLPLVIVKPKPVRKVMFFVIIGVLVVAGAFIVWRFWSNGNGISKTNVKIIDSTNQAQYHKITFYVDLELANDRSNINSSLEGYVNDLNTIYAKTTNRQFSFDAEKSVVYTSDPKFVPDYDNPIVDDFGINIFLKKSPSGIINGYFSGYDKTLGTALITLNTDKIYDNQDLSAIPADPSMWWTSSLVGYWSNLKGLAHEIAHAMGSLDYAYLASVEDTTGLSPILNSYLFGTNKKSGSRFTSDDSYWASKVSEWSNDPMISDSFDYNDYLNETRVKLLEKVKFSNLDSMIINGAYGSGYSLVNLNKTLPDMKNIKVKVFDTNNNPIKNSRIVLFSISSRTPYENSLIEDKITNGEIDFAWLSPPYDAEFRLIKVFADGYKPVVKYVSIIDAQETKLLFNKDKWEIVIVMEKGN